MHYGAVVSSSLQVELSGGGVGRRYHGAAVIESGSTLRVVEFGGLHGSRTLDATSVMQMSKCLTEYYHVVCIVDILFGVTVLTPYP